MLDRGKTSSLVVLFLCVSFTVKGQTLEYYQDVQPIIYEKCAPCHQPGQAGPFPLLTYEDVAKRSSMIRYVISNKYMPPWKADPDYRSFINERFLSSEEIRTIVQWISQGKVEGDEVEDQAMPQGLIQRRAPDLTLQMREEYDIQSTGIDDFRYFHIPTSTTEDKYMQAVEFVPGNDRYVHHSRLMADTTNNIAGIDGLSELDPKVYDFQTVPLADDFLYGWVPGNFPVFFPNGVGKKLYANTDIVLNIHYAPSGISQTDQSTINIYFAKEKVKREVQTLILREGDIIEQPFVLPANKVSNFTFKSSEMQEDISLISVMPHMHYLGQSFISYAVTPQKDTIPLIKIPEWDFNWQTMYQYKHYVKIPKGSVIHGSATYDNTSRNPLNQFFPPRSIGYGWRTTDEMMNLVFYYVPYKRGDERQYFKKH